MKNQYSFDMWVHGEEFMDEGVVMAALPAREFNNFLVVRDVMESVLVELTETSYFAFKEKGIKGIREIHQDREEFQKLTRRINKRLMKKDKDYTRNSMSSDTHKSLTHVGDRYLDSTKKRANKISVWYLIPEYLTEWYDPEDREMEISYRKAQAELVDDFFTIIYKKITKMDTFSENEELEDIREHLVKNSKMREIYRNVRKKRLDRDKKKNRRK